MNIFYGFDRSTKGDESAGVILKFKDNGESVLLATLEGEAAEFVQSLYSESKRLDKIFTSTSDETFQRKGNFKKENEITPYFSPGDYFYEDIPSMVFVRKTDLGHEFIEEIVYGKVAEYLAFILEENKKLKETHE